MIEKDSFMLLRSIIFIIVHMLHCIKILNTKISGRELKLFQETFYYFTFKYIYMRARFDIKVDNENTCPK